MGIFDFFGKEKKQESLDKGLEKTKTSFFGQLSKAVVGKSTVDIDVLDELEEILVHADVGVETTVKIIDRIEKRVARDKYVSTSELDRILREEIAALLEENRAGDGANFDLPAGITATREGNSIVLTGVASAAVELEADEAMGVEAQANRAFAHLRW